MPITLTHYFIDGTSVGKELDEYVIDYDLDLSLEYDKPYSFMDSSCSIKLIKIPGNIRETQYGSYNWLQGDIASVVIRTEIFIPGYFWGTVDYPSSVIDEVNETISLKCVGMMKYITEVISAPAINDTFSLRDGYRTSHMLLVDVLDNLLQYTHLNASGSQFNVYLTDLQMLGGFAAYPNRIIYRGEYIDSGTLNLLAYGANDSPAIKQKDFLDDLMKHYGAYVYIDGDKNLVFCNRTLWIGDKGDITLSVENDYDTYYAKPGYDSVIIHIWYDLVGTAGGGRAGVWLDGVIDFINKHFYVIDSGHATVGLPDEPNTSDVRETMPVINDPLDLRLGETFNILTSQQSLLKNGYFPFFNQYKSTEAIIDAFGDIILPLNKIRFTYFGTDIKLLNKFVINGIAYKAVNIRINFLEEKSEIEAVRI